MSYEASIIIPVLNEIKFLKNCIESIAKDCSDFNNYEIFLIDGGSTDGTIELISQIISNYSNIKYFNNAKKYAASAMNIGIDKSTTDYIIRLDAHSIYLDSYLDKALNLLKKSDLTVANVGGSIDTTPSKDKIISNTISYVLSSTFGVGNSKFRTKKLTYEIDVDTVPFGCFKKQALVDIGLYNENEKRGEDLDVNTRLIRKGYRVILSPELKSIYYSRDNYLSFIKQAFKNGYTVFAEVRGENSYHKIRHYIPLAFIIFQIFFFFSLGVKDIHILAEFLFSIQILYILLCLFFSINLVLKEKNFLYILVNPIIFLSLHSMYGLGSLFALIKSFSKYLNKIFLFN